MSSQQIIPPLIVGLVCIMYVNHKYNKLIHKMEKQTDSTTIVKKTRKHYYNQYDNQYDNKRVY